MSLNLSQLVPFQQNVGVPLVPFKAWIRTFENYLQARSDSDLRESHKWVLLIHCMGAEAQRLFYALTVTDDKYDTALEALRNFFMTKVNAVAERYINGVSNQVTDNMSVWKYGRGDDQGPNRGEDEFSMCQGAFIAGGTPHPHQSFGDSTANC